MKQIDNALTSKLQEIVGLQEEIELQEKKYRELIKCDEPFEKVKEIRSKIKYLKVELTAKQDHALALFH